MQKKLDIWGQFYSIRPISHQIFGQHPKTHRSQEFITLEQSYVTHQILDILCQLYQAWSISSQIGTQGPEIPKPSKFGQFGNAFNCAWNIGHIGRLRRTWLISCQISNQPPKIPSPKYHKCGPFHVRLVIRPRKNLRLPIFGQFRKGWPEAQKICHTQSIVKILTHFMSDL